MKSRKTTLADVYVLLAGSLWGAIGLFVNALASAGFSSMQLVAVRALTTAVVLMVFMRIYRSVLLRFRLRDIWCFLGTGVGSIVFFNFCYFNAIRMTSMSLASVLLYMAPCIVILLSLLLFHESITARKLLALALSLVGLCFVTGMVGGGSQHPTGIGILFGLGAGLGYALYTIFGRFALARGYHPLTITLWTFLFAGVSSSVFCGFPDLVLRLAAMDAGQWALVWLFGAVTSGIPFVLYTLGLSRLESGKASIMASVEPVVATLLGLLVLHQKETLGEIVGVIMVVGAVAVLNLPKRTHRTGTTDM